MAKQKQTGVTFIEIMVVIVIMGILAAVSLPTMKGVHRKNKISAAAREFSTLARYARQQAVLRNHITEIRINSTNNNYRLYLNPPGIGKRVRSSRTAKKSDMESTRYLDAKLEKIVFKTIATSAEDENLRRGGEVFIIRFHRNGSASPATIVITDERKRTLTVTITGATGAVRVKKGDLLEEREREGRNET